MSNRLTELVNRKPSRWSNLSVKEFERDIKELQEAVKKLLPLQETDLNEYRELLKRHNSLQKENERLKDEIYFLEVERD